MQYLALKTKRYLFHFHHNFYSIFYFNQLYGFQEGLPQQPLSGMVNRSGGKVRLTFKMENDQLWIGTKERTDKIPMSSIKAVVSEPIEGHEEYHIMVSVVAALLRHHFNNYSYSILDLFRFFREYSWAQPKPRGTGFTGCPLNMPTR